MNNPARKSSPWSLWTLYAAAVLLMSVSCKKEEPCDDGSCCGVAPQKLSFVKTVENARADIGLAEEFLIEGLYDTYTKGESGATLCIQQARLGTYNDQLKTSYDFRTGQPQPYKYRVWGDIYNCDNCPTTFPSNVYYLKLTRIEYQNN